MRLVVPAKSGESSTPRPIGSISGVSGILGRPVKPGDDGNGCGYRHDFAISRHVPPEVCWNFPRPSIQRAQGRPGARCTRGLVCNSCIKKRTRAYRFSGDTPAFPAQWFYGLLRALPGDRAFLPPSSARRFASRELDASFGAPGPHGFTVRSQHVRLARRHVHRSPSPRP